VAGASDRADWTFHVISTAIFKLAGLDEFPGALIIARAAALRATCTQRPSLLDSCETRGLPPSCARLLVRRKRPHVADCFDAMLRMLESAVAMMTASMSFAIVKLVHCCGRAQTWWSRAFRYQRHAFIPPPLPDVRERRDSKLLLSSMF